MGCCTLLRTGTALALCVANVHTEGPPAIANAASRALDDNVDNWWQGAAGADGQGGNSGEEQASSSAAGSDGVPLWWQEEGPTEAATSSRAPTEPPTAAPTAEEGWTDANVNSVPAVVVRPPTSMPALPGGGSEIQVVCFFGLVEPCGQVIVPGSGLQLKTPLGELQIKGSESCGLEEEAPINSNYALMVCLALLTLTALCILCLPGHRQDLHRFRDMVVRGKASNDHVMYDRVGTGVEPDHDDQDMNSHRALVASGIYQALAVLHPGVLGYHWWSKCCTKAIACCVVQLYLTASLLHQVLSDWEFHNLKSPIWFLTNAWNMLAAFVGFGMLCNLFSMRSTENLLTNVEATAFILGKRHLGLLPEEDTTKQDDVSGLLLVLLEPSIQAAARVNAFFWSFLSILTDLSLALMLQAVFLLRFATYWGSAEQMILVAVVLFFVLDADRRVLDADPRLRRAYSKHIMSLESLTEAPRGPSCLVRLGAVFALILRCTVPAGLLLAALTAWLERASGRVWGGSPLCDSSGL